MGVAVVADAEDIAESTGHTLARRVEDVQWVTADGIPAHELSRRSMDELTAEMQLRDGATCSM